MTNDQERDKRQGPKSRVFWILGLGIYLVIGAWTLDLITFKNINFNQKIIIGIDPGIADTGWGVIVAEKNKLVCLAYGSIKTAAKTPLAERLDILHIELTKIIQKYRPTTAGVEQLFFCTNVKTAMTVGQARGVILLTLAQQKLIIKEFTPLQVKQAVSSYGGADKSQVQKMVKLLLGLKEIPKPDDAADALAMAIAASNRV